MTFYRVAAPAEDQIARILARSMVDYGHDRATNYGLLIIAAMEDVAADPKRLGAKPVPRSGGVWVYQLWHSRNRLPRHRRVRDPWHKILYRPVAGSGIEILAIVGRSYPTVRAAREAVLER
jgi:plasmid stabilization system protein ParE